jgi:uncharacterized membrane protein YsdA (DUF1294 family)
MLINAADKCGWIYANSQKVSSLPAEVLVTERLLNTINKFQFSEQMIPLKHLHVVLIYLAVINVGTFFMYGIDKWKAKKSKWRIRETALLGLAVLGGSIGAWLGMKVWHHKTQHKKFKYGVPAIIIIQLALIVYFIISKTI